MWSRFFTIPAVGIVGETGCVYALDVNVAAVEHVRRKIERTGLVNAEVKLADASETGLANESIDVAFLFGVMHSFKEVNKVLKEMHRVLKTNGTMSIQSRVATNELIRTVSANGFFQFRGETKGISFFEKTERGTYDTNLGKPIALVP